MKKVKVEVETTLTYKPFENIGDMLKKATPNKKDKEEKNNGK